MDTKVSDIIHRIGGVDFSAIRFGGTDALLAVVASMSDDRKWVISPILQKLTYRVVEDYANDIYSSALLAAADEEASRYLPEVFAYVRHLPIGKRSNYVDSPDHELANEAMGDVRRALVPSLAQIDAFRAAVEFESRVPYLVADRGLIDVMDPIIEEFRYNFDESKWVSSACENEEDNLRRETPFLSAQISVWKGEGAALSAFR